ncbi:MAG: hypothetical protein KA110_10410, partial [Acidimicrobiia bacterium]|nr:hypothetical protein [Acidimicrobiia bacterium]
MPNQPWWNSTPVYQIYPRSFCGLGSSSDAGQGNAQTSQDGSSPNLSGDGIGDLAGVISKLDYLADLGGGAVWLSPFFVSPQQDFGYDIADYEHPDPAYGTDEDVDELIAQ